MDGVEAIHTIHPGFEERSIAKAPFRNSYFLLTSSMRHPN